MAGIYIVDPDSEREVESLRLVHGIAEKELSAILDDAELGDEHAAEQLPAMRETVRWLADRLRHGSDR